MTAGSVIWGGGDSQGGLENHECLVVWCVLMKGLSQGWKVSWGDVLSIPEGPGYKPFPTYGHLVITAVGTVSALWASLVAQTESNPNVGDLGSIAGLGRPPGGGHGNPLQHSCPENPHEQRNLLGYSPWGHKELEMTE